MLMRFFIATALTTFVAANYAGLPKDGARPANSDWIDAHDGIIFDMALSKDGSKLITVGNDGAVERNMKIWDLETKKCIRIVRSSPQRQLGFPQFLPGTNSIVAMVFHSDPKRRIGWEVYECEIKNGTEKALFSSKEADRPVALWSDRRIVVVSAEVAGADGMIFALKFIDYENNKERCLQLEKPFKVRGFTPDRKFVALEFANGTFKVYDWAKEKKLCEIQVALEKKSHDVPHCYLSSDGRSMLAIVGAIPCRFEKWDIIDGKLLQSGKLYGSFHRIMPVSVSPDERLLAVPNGHNVLFYDLAKGMKPMSPQNTFDGEVPKLRGGEGIIRFLPDGKSYILGYDRGKVLHLKTPNFDP